MAVYQQTAIESDPDAYGLESPTIISRTPPAMILPDLTLEEHSVILVESNLSRSRRNLPNSFDLPDYSSASSDLANEYSGCYRDSGLVDDGLQALQDESLQENTSSNPSINSAGTDNQGKKIYLVLISMH